MLDRATRILLVGLLALNASVALAQRSTPVQLLHPSGAGGDQFGSSVAIDGDTLVVGAPFDDVSGNSNRGSAHVYRWTSTGWAFEATLSAADGAGGDEFGYAVGISGDTIVVGALTDDVGGISNQGSAYIFTREGTAWTQQAQLTGPSGAANDNFGVSVAIWGNTTLVGAWNRDIGSNANQGCAYVFTRSGDAWTQQARLVATGGAANDQFGVSVAISDTIALVGAWQDDVGTAVNQGSAYVFTRSGDAWTQQARLSGSNSGANDGFGYSVALSGTTALIGAYADSVNGNDVQGSAYVFTRSGGVWSQEAQLTAADGAAADAFGWSVALSGDTAVIGAKFDDLGAATDQGSARVFKRTSGVWTQDAVLAIPTLVTRAFLGHAVAISGDLVVVGSYQDDIGANADQGSAWVFSRVGDQWFLPDTRLLPSDPAQGDKFGSSVAISGDTLAIGVPDDDVGSNVNRGSVYVFARSGGAWVEQAHLFAADGITAAGFGSAVALSGDTLLVGAPFASGSIYLPGAAYVFRRTGTTWAQEARISPPQNVPGSLFGQSVALEGSTAVIGSDGAACVFDRTGTTWSLAQGGILVSNEAPNRFGASVAVMDFVIVVGAPDDSGAVRYHGAAYIFQRAGLGWTFHQKLLPGVSNSLGYMGESVCLIPTAGSPKVVAGSPGFYGSAVYVFARSGLYWTQEALIVPPEGQTDQFGLSVAGVGAAGDTIVIGAPSAGAAYLYTRANGSWVYRQTLTPQSASPGASFGRSVAASATRILIGDPSATIDSATERGFALLMQFEDPALVYAERNGSSGSYLSAAAAFATHPTSAVLNEAAWRGLGSLFVGPVSVQSSGDVRWPSEASLTIAAPSSVSAYSSEIEVHGELVISDTFSFAGDSFVLGSRGSMRCNAGKTVRLDVPAARVRGRATLGEGSLLQTIGNLTLDCHASLSAGPGARVRTAGDFDCAIDSNSRFDLSTAILEFSAGNGATKTLEVMSTDVGPGLAGFNSTAQGNYPFQQLDIGPEICTVRLVDKRDNDGLGQADCEALYVDTLTIHPGCRLINPSCRIYCKTLVNLGSVDVPGNLLLVSPCRADFNTDGSLDPDDLGDFITCYFSVVCARADFNADGNLDPDDLGDFITAYFGGCP